MAENVSKAELVKRIRAGYADFHAMLATLSPAQIVAEKLLDLWSIKDCIAHLIAHEQFALTELDYALRGERMDYDERDTDSINADAVIDSHQKPLDQVLAEWDRSFQQVIAAVEALSDQHFALGSALQDNLCDTVDGAFGNNTYQHYAEHLQRIRERLGRQGMA